MLVQLKWEPIEKYLKTKHAIAKWETKRSRRSTTSDKS